MGLVVAHGGSIEALLQALLDAGAAHEGAGGREEILRTGGNCSRSMLTIVVTAGGDLVGEECIVHTVHQ